MIKYVVGLASGRIVEIDVAEGENPLYRARMFFGRTNVEWVQLRSEWKPQTKGTGYEETARLAAEQLIDQLGNKEAALEKIADKSGDYYDFMRKYLGGN